MVMVISGLLPVAAIAQESSGTHKEPADQKASSTEGGSKSDPGVAPTIAVGQQDQTKTDPQAGQNPITQPLALSPDIPRARVGVREDQNELLTLQDAVEMALKNNLDIEITRQGVQMAQYNLFAARGFYDVTSSGTIGYRNSVSPVSSIFGGGGEQGAVSQNSIAYNFNTNQQVEKTGGNYSIDFNNSRINTSATFATLSPQFNNTLSITYTQPLMRNLSIDQNRRQVQLLRRALDLSDSQFRQKVIDIITQTQRAYWDLVFTIRNEQIARDAVELARTQLENNRKMVEAGTQAPIELRSNEAALEARKGDVITALQSITTAENTLKGLLLKDPNDKIWYSAIVPTDEPQFGRPTYTVEDATALALKNRPELEQLNLQAEQNQVDIRFFKNQSKPQFDLVGIYSNTGLAGTVVPSFGPDGSPQPTTVIDRFVGGYGQSLKNLFGQDFRTYQIGVTISFPWRNRTAESNLGHALAQSKQLDAQQRQLVQFVQMDVRNALQAVVATRQQYEAAKANRIAAVAQYQGEQEKFRAGLSSNFLVLDRQNALSAARGSEVRALTDYNKALADLQRATGLTMVSNNVEFTALPDKK
jgi:HAE1 family hydrophobic/amphiphilic exporter-1